MFFSTHVYAFLNRIALKQIFKIVNILSNVPITLVFFVKVCTKIKLLISMFQDEVFTLFNCLSSLCLIKTDLSSALQSSCIHCVKILNTYLEVVIDTEFF